MLDLGSQGILILMRKKMNNKIFFSIFSIHLGLFSILPLNTQELEEKDNEKENITVEEMEEILRTIDQAYEEEILEVFKPSDSVPAGIPQDMPSDI